MRWHGTAVPSPLYLTVPVTSLTCVCHARSGCCTQALSTQALSPLALRQQAFSGLRKILEDHWPQPGRPVPALIDCVLASAWTEMGQDNIFFQRVLEALAPSPASAAMVQGVRTALRACVVSNALPSPANPGAHA